MIHDTGYYHVFPFKDIQKGENIIIWGMGEVGRQYVQQVRKTDYCHIRFCVDKGWEAMSKYMDLDIVAPEKVKGRSERVVIANGSEDVVEKIKNELRKYGLTDERIVHNDLICENTVAMKEIKSSNLSGSNFLMKYSHGRLKELVDVSFYVIGGLGDLLINCNYILAFKEKFKDESIKIKINFQPFRQYIIDFLPDTVKNEIEISFSDKEREVDEEKSDLFILIKRYPWVKRANIEKMKLLSPALAKYALMCKRFEMDHARYFGNHAAYDGISAMESEADGVHRYNQGDIYGFLSMGEKTYIKFPNRRKEMQRFNLPKKYITVNRDIDSAKGKKGSVLKLWPTDYYSKLIQLIKKEYPDYLIVIVGSNCDENLMGYDIDLVGKTTPVELEAILQNSSLHISSEGGTVHLRHFLEGGMSVVLFGPTSPSFYGYKENLNLRSTSCEHPCEWTTRNWNTVCINSLKKQMCMLDLTPEIVMKKIKEKWVMK